MGITVFFNTMPRYRRRYTKTIVRAPRKKWNAQRDILASNWLTYNTNFAHVASLVLNSADNATPSPVTLKAKHISVMGCLTLQSTVQAVEDPHPVFYVGYILYVPEVVYASAPTSGQATMYTYWETVVNNHPEWIMSKKNVPSTFTGALPGEKNVTKWTQTTGILSRNLKSGDRICYVGLGTLINAGSIGGQLSGLTTSLVCAN